MAPMVFGSKENNDELKIFNEKLKKEKNKLLELRKYVENNFEFVGTNFSRKVREIYYDNKNKKMIYGTATSKERKELEAEGIDLLSIPWINKIN